MSSDQLKGVMEKLQELVRKHELLKKENEKLRTEVIHAKQRESGFIEQISSLEQKVMVLKVGTGRLDDTEKKELDKKLHAYLKEIDRCISMLSD